MSKLYLTDAFIAVHPSLNPSGWLKPGYLLIEDGSIRALSAQPLPEAQTADAERLSLPERAITPVWVNGHTHLSQTLLRGLAGGRPLLRWLKERIWPLQDAFTPEAAHIAALLGLAENIRSGCGVVVDHQKITGSPAHTEAVYRAARQSGVRVWLARAWSDRGSNAEPAAAIVEELQGWLSRNRPGELVQFASGPLTPWRCSADTLRATHELACQHRAFTHIHVSETLDEVDLHLNEYNLRPVEWLAQIGVLDEQTHIVHAVWLNDNELNLLAEKRPLIVHCPVSNAVLGSGIAPLGELLKRGLRLRLGTDGPASNDTQDSLETMKIALCFARAVQRDASLVPPRTALQMAWDSPGLQAGQPADLAIVRLTSVWTAPVHNLDSALALCARADNVESLMVAGEFILRDGSLLTLDESSILREASQMTAWLRRKAGLAEEDAYPLSYSSQMEQP